MLGTNSQRMGGDESVSLSLQEERKKEERSGKKERNLIWEKRLAVKSLEAGSSFTETSKV